MGLGAALQPACSAFIYIKRRIEAADFRQALTLVLDSGFQNRGWRGRLHERRGASSRGLADSLVPVLLPEHHDACLQARISLGVRLAQLRKKAGITSDMTAKEVEAALKHAKADSEAEAEAQRLQKEKAAEEVQLLELFCQLTGIYT